MKRWAAVFTLAAAGCTSTASVTARSLPTGDLHAGRCDEETNRDRSTSAHVTDDAGDVVDTGACFDSVAVRRGGHVVARLVEPKRVRVSPAELVVGADRADEVSVPLAADDVVEFERACVGCYVAIGVVSAVVIGLAVTVQSVGDDIEGPSFPID